MIRLTDDKKNEDQVEQSGGTAEQLPIMRLFQVLKTDPVARRTAYVVAFYNMAPLYMVLFEHWNILQVMAIYLLEALATAAVCVVKLFCVTRSLIRGLKWTVTFFVMYVILLGILCLVFVLMIVDPMTRNGALDSFPSMHEFFKPLIPVFLMMTAGSIVTAINRGLFQSRGRPEDAMMEPVVRFFVLLFCFGFGGVVARFFGGILSLIIIIAIKTVVDLLLQVSVKTSDKVNKIELIRIDVKQRKGL